MTLPLATCVHCAVEIPLDRKGGFCSTCWMLLPDGARMTIINAWNRSYKARMEAIGDALRLLTADTITPSGDIL